MATKRKHSEVTLKAKYKTLEEIDKNKPNKEVAIQFNVSRSTLATWKKQVKISKFVTEMTKESKENICDALRDLAPFVQFKKREKHPWRGVNFSKIAGSLQLY